MYEDHPNEDEEYREALQRWDLCLTADKEQRRLAIEDLLFINAEDGQWSEDVVSRRKNRPRYTIDKISPALAQLIGNQRQTRSAIKILPGKDGEEKTARIYSGLIRSIETNSNANNAYDVGYDEAASCGYGALCKVVTDYENNETFDQIIQLKPINSAASTHYCDPTAQEYDKRDSMFQFLVSAMVIGDFKKKYPNAAVTDFDTPVYKKTGITDWFSSDGIRLAEYWYKVPKKKKIGLMSDGTVIDLEEEKAVLDELAARDITVVREREVESYEIYMRVMNGAEFLTEPQKWAGKYIPIVPLYGKTAVVDGKVFVRGMVRKSKDAQRIYNYTTSTIVETTALTPKDPFFYTPTNILGHEQKWKEFPAKNTPFLPYTPDPTNQGAPPTKAGAPTVQSALIQQKQDAAMDIHATTGLEPASLGNVPELKSGKAIEAQQAMGDRGSYIYEDNLKKSKKLLGDILVDLIPRIYDTQRIIKVLGEDEVMEDVEINAPENGINLPITDEQTGKQVLVNDLSQGEYNTVVTSGPAFATKKQETVSQLITLSGTNEVVGQLALDLIIDNMDLNNSDEIKKRVRKYMIDQGTIEPTEDEAEEMGLDQPPPEDPMENALVENLNMQTEKLISEIQNKDADTQSKIMSAQKDSVAALTTLIETMIKKMDANIPITPEDVETIEGQQALVQETQEDVLEGQEIAGSLPMDVKGQQLPPENVQPPAVNPLQGGMNQDNM
jgi:hypothetical protein